MPRTIQFAHGVGGYLNNIDFDFQTFISYAQDLQACRFFAPPSCSHQVSTTPVVGYFGRQAPWHPGSNEAALRSKLEAASGRSIFVFIAPSSSHLACLGSCVFVLAFTLAPRRITRQASSTSAGGSTWAIHGALPELDSSGCRPCSLGRVAPSDLVEFA